MVALAVDYVLALGTSAGLYADRTALLRGFGGPSWDQAHAATSRLVDTIDIASLSVFSVGVVVLALLQRRPQRALAGAAVLAGANLTTQFLKPGLGAVDPLGGDAERAFGSVFPSGHATVAMSATLALLLVLPPSWRAIGAVLTAGYSAAIGIGLVMLGWHYPSDVLGGFLVATAWAAAAIAVLRLRPEPEPSPVRGGAGLIGAGAVALLGLTATLAVASRLGDIAQLEQYGRLHTSFFAGSAIIALFAAGLPATVAALLMGERLSSGTQHRSDIASPATPPVSQRAAQT